MTVRGRVGPEGALWRGRGGRGVPGFWVGLAGGAGGLWGVDDRGLGDGDVDEGLDEVMLGGRLCGSGGRLGEGGSGCGWWGVLVWVRVRERAVSLGLSSFSLWCWALRGVVLVVMPLLLVWSFGFRLGFGVGFWVGVRFEVEEDLVLEVRGHWCRVRGVPGMLPGCLGRLCGGRGAPVA